MDSGQGGSMMATGLAKEDLRWTNPLHLTDFRCKYFFRVYSYLTVQFIVIGVVSYIITQDKSLQQSLERNNPIAVTIILLGLASYGLLYVKYLNHPDKTHHCALMQGQFTIFMSLLAGALSGTYYFYSIVFASAQISLTCLIICIAYRFFSFEFHHIHGIRFAFFFQSLFAGSMMLALTNLGYSQYQVTVYITGAVEGLIISTLMMIYFAYGTNRLTTSRFIRFKLENFLFGVTLLYTTGIVKIYYQKKK